MKRIRIATLALLMVIAVPGFANGSSTVVISVTNTYEEDVLKYKKSLKEYRELRAKARAEIRSARLIYLAARKQATSREARKEALDVYRAAKVTALSKVPAKPLRPSKLDLGETQ